MGKAGGVKSTPKPKVSKAMFLRSNSKMMQNRKEDLEASDKRKALTNSPSTAKQSSRDRKAEKELEGFKTTSHATKTYPLAKQVQRTGNYGSNSPKYPSLKTNSKKPSSLKGTVKKK